MSRDAVVGGEFLDDVTPLERRPGEPVEDDDRGHVTGTVVNSENGVAVELKDGAAYPPMLDRCHRHRMKTITVPTQPMGV